MKLLYLAKDKLNSRYKSLFKSFGVEYFQYANPLKSMDNLPELQPDIFFMVKEDYPRFWKMILISLRENDKTNHCTFILQGNLNEKEIEAFNYLKGSIYLSDLEDITPIKEKLVEINKKRITNKVLFPEAGDLSLGFVKSDDFSFITGDIVEISSNELIFKPENLEDLKGIEVGTEILNASLSRDDAVINIDLIIKDVTDTLFCSIKESKTDFIDLVNLLFV